MVNPVDHAAGDRLLAALRTRATEVGLRRASDQELLTRLELELREYRDPREAAVKALRQRLAEGPAQ
jgi:hypothetical protein